jgi:hypothetical protein
MLKYLKSLKLKLKSIYKLMTAKSYVLMTPRNKHEDVHFNASIITPTNCYIITEKVRFNTGGNVLYDLRGTSILYANKSFNEESGHLVSFI